LSLELSKPARAIEPSKINDNNPEFTEDVNKIFRQAGIPTSENIGDIWIDTDDNAMYFALSVGANAIVTSGSTGWMRRDDVDAINNATTKIVGGLINTQKIILKDGGGSNPVILQTGTGGSQSTARIELDNNSITGYSNATNVEFKIDAADGKAKFANGAIILDCDGINLDNVVTSGNGANNKFIQFTKTGESASSSFFIQRYVTSSEDRLIIGKGGGDIVQISGHLYGRDISQSNLGSSATPWGKLYVTGGTGDGVYIGDRLLRNNSGTLEWNGSEIGGGTSDNYVSWRYRTDTSSYEDVISNESVSIRGGNDIGITHSGGTITVAYTGSSGSGDIEGVNITAGYAMHGSVNTTSGTHTQTLAWTGSTLNVATSNNDADYFVVVNSSGYSFKIAHGDISHWSGGGGSGTVNSGAANRGAIYTSAGTTLNDTNYYMSVAQVGSTSTEVTTMATSRLYVSGSTVQFSGLGTSWGGRYASFDSSGNLTSYSSSRRYKENIENLSIDTSKIFDLTTRQFKYKDYTKIIHGDEEDPDEEETITVVGPTSFGLIAEEVNEHIPELVAFNNDGEPDAVNYPLISILLLEEMRKLKARIEVLEGI